MEREAQNIRDDSTGIEGIRRVMLAQYALHEAIHAESCSVPGTAVPTVPRAHTLADVYKCLHQGQFWVGHSIGDPARFAKNLAFDLLSAVPSSTEPVVETVSPGGLVFRINLRPYRGAFSGRDEWASSLLVEACLRSAEIKRGDAAGFMASLQWFKDLNNSGALAIHGRSYRFPAKMVASFLRQVAEWIESSGDVPVLSHSPVYKRYNSPSYRVVDREALEQSALASLLRDTA